jgi:hydroxymethylbilane synthase
MKKTILTIATRESPLALWQANWVKSQLEKNHPQLTVQLLGMTTRADRMPYLSLTEVGGKGLFVKELEEALLDGRADVAVHSMKDMPTELPPGLCLPVMCEREDPWDVFISHRYASLDKVPTGAIIGTSSLRRTSQLLYLRPDLKTQGLRGNVNTRLTRLDAGEFAGIILAAAGIKRLGFQQRIREVLSPEHFLPAPGQGVLGLECRENDIETQQLLTPLNDKTSYTCVSAERAMCKRLGGGCQVPIAAYAEIKQNKLMLQGLVAQVDGKKILHAQYEAALSDAETLGVTVADDLLSQGAGDILRALAGRA